MMLCVIRPMLIAMNIWQNRTSVLLRRKRRGEKLFGFSPFYNHYDGLRQKGGFAAPFFVKYPYSVLYGANSGAV